MRFVPKRMTPRERTLVEANAAYVDAVMEAVSSIASASVGRGKSGEPDVRGTMFAANPDWKYINKGFLIRENVLNTLISIYKCFWAVKLHLRTGRDLYILVGLDLCVCLPRKN